MNPMIKLTTRMLGATTLVFCCAVTPASGSTVDVESTSEVNGIAPDDGRYDQGAYAQSVKPEADALRALYGAYGDAAAGRVTAKELNQVADDFEKRTGKSVEEAAPIPRLAKVNSGLATNRAAVAAVGVGHQLLMTHYSQGAIGHYCGPATAKMILNWEGRSTSAYNSSHNNTQARLATDTYLRTDSHGSTDWGSGDMPHGVNRFYGGNYLVQLKDPTLSQFVGAVTSNIDNSDAAAVGTTEYAGSHHYNGHPAGSTYRHWMPVNGYTTDAASIRFLDSASSLWTGVNERFSYTTNTFRVRFIKPEYGIAS